MANPATTHVIEIETGIGEPAFIPLTLGQELQPISVGKKGMWRIESPRVMDVHAFVYFDGSSLFLQSADESAAATVDGYKIGKAWTELHAPCTIEIGVARLRYRSLLPDGDSAMTVVKASPPVQGAPGGPGGGGPRPGPPRSESGQVRALPNPPAPGEAPPQALTFPKADRPFKPGEFSSRVDDESTRIAPVAPLGEGTGTRGMTGHSVRPAAGRAADEDLMTRPEAAQAMQRGATGAVQAVQPMHSMQPQTQGQPQGTGPYAPIGAGPMQSAMQSMPPGMGGPMPMMGGPPGYANPMFASGTYPPQGYPPNAMGPGGYAMPPSQVPREMMGPSMPPGGFGSMTPQGGSQQQPPGALPELAARFKEMSVPKRIAVILLPISMVLAVWSIWSDDEPPAQVKKPRAADGGAAPAAAAAADAAVAGTTPPVMTTSPPSTAWPAGVPCPPPNWPPNVPLPCTPNGVKGPPDTTPAPPTSTPPATSGRDGGKDHGKDKDAGAANPPGVKTLERQAVDALAQGNTAQAATLYEELSRRDPNSRVYAEAARILRAKLDAGAP